MMIIFVSGKMAAYELGPIYKKIPPTLGSGAKFIHPSTMDTKEDTSVLAISMVTVGRITVLLVMMEIPGAGVTGA
jgi:hypothetical protein